MLSRFQIMLCRFHSFANRIRGSGIATMRLLQSEFQVVKPFRLITHRLRHPKIKLSFPALFIFFDESLIRFRSYAFVYLGSEERRKVRSDRIDQRVHVAVRCG